MGCGVPLAHSQRPCRRLVDGELGAHSPAVGCGARWPTPSVPCRWLVCLAVPIPLGQSPPRTLALFFFNYSCMHLAVLGLCRGTQDLLAVADPGESQCEPLVLEKAALAK